MRIMGLAYTFSLAPMPSIAPQSMHRPANHGPSPRRGSVHAHHANPSADATVGGSGCPVVAPLARDETHDPPVPPPSIFAEGNPCKWASGRSGGGCPCVVRTDYTSRGMRLPMLPTWQTPARCLGRHNNFYLNFNAPRCGKRPRIQRTLPAHRTPRCGTRAAAPPSRRARRRHLELV